MEQIYTRQAGLVERRTDEQERAVYRFRISTPGLKGDGIDIPNESWDLDRYRKHPTVLYNHDIRNMLPIGRSERLWLEDDGLWADVLLDVDDPEAARIAGKLDRGFLTGVSVNFRPHNINRSNGQPERTELVELSIVSVPEDADVLMARSLWGMPPYAPYWPELQATVSDTARLSITTIQDEIAQAGIDELGWHLKDSLGDVRALVGRLVNLGLDDDLRQDIQETIVALRLLFDMETDAPADIDEVVTIDLSQFPALTGAQEK